MNSRPRERLEQLAQDNASRLSPKEAATYLGVSVATVTRMARLGQLDARRVAGRWRIAADAVERLLEGNETEAV